MQCTLDLLLIECNLAWHFNNLWTVDINQVNRAEHCKLIYNFENNHLKLSCHVTQFIHGDFMLYIITDGNKMSEAITPYNCVHSCIVSSAQMQIFYYIWRLFSKERTIKLSNTYFYFVGTIYLYINFIFLHIWFLLTTFDPILFQHTFYF